MANKIFVSAFVEQIYDFLDLLNKIVEQIVEFVLLEILKQFLKSNNKSSDERKTYYTFYTLGQILKYEIRNVNPQIVELIHIILHHFQSQIKKEQLKTIQEQRLKPELLTKMLGTNAGPKWSTLYS